MRTRNLLLILVLVLATPLLAYGDDHFIGFRLADGVSRQALSNGLVVITKPESDARSVAFDLVCRVGAAQEDTNTSGMAALISRMLESRLTEPNGKPDDLIDRTGTVTNVNVALDYTELSVVTTPSHAREILQRLLQAYGRRPFTDTEILKTKQKLVKELEAGSGDFNSVYDLFLQVFYRYHPYRQPLAGNPAAVRNFTPQQVNAFVTKWYAPNRTIVSIVGNVDSDIASTVRQSSLGSLNSVPDNNEMVTWEPVSTEKEIQLTSDAQMAYLFLGYPAPSVQSADYPVMRVVQNLLGTGVSSRLWVDLREERGLAYELGTEYPTLAGPSHFLNYVITTPRQVRLSKHRMFDVIESMRTKTVTNQELEYAKWKAVGSIMAALETPLGQAQELASSEAQGVGYQFTDRLIDNIWRVGPIDVLACANRYFNNYTLIVARPPGTQPLLPDHW
ncbi:MAG: M16 family metallopeptidase [Candidatus Xenobia bacterium]